MLVIRLPTAKALVLVGLALTAPRGFAQDVMVRELDTDKDRLGWAEGLSDVPVVDLTGLWRFDDDASDPMVEIWSDREVAYEISQQSNRIVMIFRPSEGETTVQEYRWDGSVVSSQRDQDEVRERARWIQGGRVLEIEGRRWPADDIDAVTRYRFVYALAAGRDLVFRQIDEFGETTWIFRR